MKRVTMDLPGHAAPTCSRVARRLALCCVVVLLATVSTISAGAAPSGDTRPYDSRLMRLSEILGAVHYLRELCDGKDGMRWRDAVGDLIKSEGTTALRRATIAQRFNLGYRSYRRTYRKCTPSARNTIERFFKEAIEISDALVTLGK